MSSCIVEAGPQLYVLAALKDQPHSSKCILLFLLLGIIAEFDVYAMENPFGQFKLAVLAVSTPSLLVPLGRYWRDCVILCEHSSGTDGCVSTVQAVNTNHSTIGLLWGRLP